MRNANHQGPPQTDLIKNSGGGEPSNVLTSPLESDASFYLLSLMRNLDSLVQIFIKKVPHPDSILSKFKKIIKRTL